MPAGAVANPTVANPLSAAAATHMRQHLLTDVALTIGSLRLGVRTTSVMRARPAHGGSGAYRGHAREEHTM